MAYKEPNNEKSHLILGPEPGLSALCGKFNMLAGLSRMKCTARIDGEALVLQGNVDDLRTILAAARVCSKADEEYANYEKYVNSVSGSGYDTPVKLTDQDWAPLMRGGINLTKTTSTPSQSTVRPNTSAWIAARKEMAKIGNQRAGKEVPVMRIISLFGFEEMAPKGYIRSNRPWVLGRFRKAGEGEEAKVVLEFGQPIGGRTNLYVGDVLSTKEFSEVYRYCKQAGKRYGLLKRRDKHCHHSFERFEV